MPQVQERSFSFNGFRYACQQWGDTGLPVLAIHGWLDNSSSFEILANKLTGVQILAPDLAGHGFTDHRPGFSDYPIWSEVMECFSIADEMEWDQFALVGHSRGAMMSLLAAAAFPERITHLVLIDALAPNPVHDSEAPDRILRSIREMHRRVQRKRSCYPTEEAALNARCKSEFGGVTRESAEILARRGLVKLEEGYHWHADGKLWAPSKVGLTAEQIKAFTEKVTAKTLLLAAEGGIKPPITPGSEFEALINWILKKLNADVKHFDDGHFLHMEKAADDVATAIQEFLAP